MPHYLHCIVVEFPDGGQRMNCFKQEKSAIENSKEVIKHIKKENSTGMKVYLSELLLLEGKEYMAF